MKKRITITYSQITPESAEHGDFSETGWVNETGEVFESAEEALDFLRDSGVVEASSNVFHPGIWYSTDSACIDYSSGTEESQSYHLEGFTEAEEQFIYQSL